MSNYDPCGASCIGGGHAPEEHAAWLRRDWVEVRGEDGAVLVPRQRVDAPPVSGDRALAWRVRNDHGREDRIEAALVASRRVRDAMDAHAEARARLSPAEIAAFDRRNVDECREWAHRRGVWAR